LSLSLSLSLFLSLSLSFLVPKNSPHQKFMLDNNLPINIVDQIVRHIIANTTDPKLQTTSPVANENAITNTVTTSLQSTQRLEENLLLILTLKINLLFY
jgi:hypothetical protein